MLSLPRFNEPVNSGLDTLLKRYLWTPAQNLLSQCNIRLSRRWIILPLGQKPHWRCPPLAHPRCHDLGDDGRHVRHRYLSIAPNVHRTCVVAVHQRHEAAHTIPRVLEAPCCAPITVNRQWVSVHGGNDKVGHCPSVIGLHVRTVRVEDARDANLNVVLGLKGVGEGLERPFAFVVAGAGAEAVNVAPIGLGLAADLGVTVDLYRPYEEDRE